jgi:hypothetical protein
VVVAGASHPSVRAPRCGNALDRARARSRLRNPTAIDPSHRTDAR